MNNDTKMNNFITEIIENDIANNDNNYKISTRFPPEPNGFLHIGHAKSIFLNYGLAKQYNGKCNLRFDDTNPVKENIDYINSIISDVKWLLGDKNIGEILYASDYFEQMHCYALDLIKKGYAYVDDQTSEQIKKNRGDYNIIGTNSPFRERTIDENLKLFEDMRKGLYEDGEKVLRAKISMSSKNLNLRDPIMYRILKVNHHRTGNKWPIYPMYDWAHGLEDSIEGITHSICTLEFEDHRPIYDWFLEKLDIYHPQQIEFAKLDMTYTIFSKRNLLKLVEKQLVNGWDDPRMPTISGLRRRGYTPESIKNFIMSLGFAKSKTVSDLNHLEHFLRENLNLIAYRVMAVINPIKLIIENYPDDKVEYMEVENNPEDKTFGSRKIAFSKELYIEREDFSENPPKKFFRLAVGNEVRLRNGYYVVCNDFKKDSLGNITEVRCSYDPETKGGWSNDGRKVRGTIHWVSCKHSLNAEVRIYDKLFDKENPLKTLKDDDDFTFNISPSSINTIEDAKVESFLINAEINQKFQFLRKGYFVLDSDSTSKKLIFNQSVALRSSWNK
ncbi:MAG: glutamine--tRNA ligase [Candidatus Marinimicrobia bacterium]|nr:glutamine--tRNA ligase [Candidatus Neomarinimicrobiota bacterium]